MTTTVVGFKRPPAPASTTCPRCDFPRGACLCETEAFKALHEENTRLSARAFEAETLLLEEQQARHAVATKLAALRRLPPLLREAPSARCASILLEEALG
jgi:hypothetical protein